jgi:hypothetical protein
MRISRARDRGSVEGEEERTTRRRERRELSTMGFTDGSRVEWLDNSSLIKCLPDFA